MQTRRPRTQYINIIKLSKIGHVALMKITRCIDIYLTQRRSSEHELAASISPLYRAEASCSGPALATADAQTPAPPPDLNVTGKPDDTATMDPDTSVGSINNSLSGLRIRVPDGFGGVTTLPTA